MDACVEARSACAKDNTQVDYQWGERLTNIVGSLTGSGIDRE